MTRGKLLTTVFVAALTAGAAPAWAQRGSAERADPDSRPSGPERTGAAVDRPSSSGGSSGGSSSSAGGSGGGGGSVNSGGGSSWSAPSSSSPSSGSSNNEYARAPERPSRNAEREQGRARGASGEGRRPGSGGAVGSARPRGTDDEHTVGAGTTRTAPASAGTGNDSAPARRAVPTYSRPSDGRQPTGVAVDRTNAVSRPGSVSTLYYNPFYSSRGYYVPGYGFGLGYYYDPLWYDPYYGGGYYGGGGGYYGGGYASGYGGAYQGGYGSSSYDRAPTGNLRLKIKPRDAQVFVDGFFVGVVDSFDGVFQKLGIDAGGHRIEIRAAGYEPIHFEVLITPGETVTYKGELRRR